MVGEGAGVLILEELELAAARGARIYRRARGLRHVGDAYHITAPSEDGDGAVPRDAERARERQRSTRPGRLHQRARHVDAATATRSRRSPSSALSASMPASSPVSSTKSMTGHLLGGAGGLEAGITAAGRSPAMVPPTINLEHPDPECDLDYVPNRARQASIRVRAVELVRVRRHQRGAAVQEIRTVGNRQH